MKVQENLVFNKHTNELIGFIDLGDPDINFATLPEPQTLAKYAMVYYIRGIVTSLKFSLAYFATDGVKSSQLFLTFWEAVCILELFYQLYIIAAVCDGATANRKFFTMHEKMSDCSGKIIYRTKNLFCMSRYIWFFADPPHLMKTARNCLLHSAYTSSSRCMWNDGDYLLWEHIQQLHIDHQGKDLHRLLKLTADHIHLNSYSVMNVKLAVQVLSDSVGKVLKTFYPKDYHKTAEFCINMNNFFDLLNVRHPDEGKFHKNKFMVPFEKADDFRFGWIQNEFLPYFENWKKSIDEKLHLTKSERDRMFISRQTYEGIFITAMSVTEMTLFLLKQGVKFVLTEKLNQDSLEEYFGRQRSLGRRNDNPSIFQFGFHANTIRTQRCHVPITGNVRVLSGKRKISWENVDNSHLKKRHTQRK